MVATFILTRTFAISALFVGAFDLVHAAPVSYSLDARAEPSIEERNCRLLGCLFAKPHEVTSAASFSEAAPPDEDTVKRELQRMGLLSEPIPVNSAVAELAVTHSASDTESQQEQDATVLVDVEYRSPAPQQVPPQGSDAFVSSRASTATLEILEENGHDSVRSEEASRTEEERKLRILEPKNCRQGGCL
ncbi:uncharacterized protein LAESUDRAFT_750580 [Laetiporus sulphureus 93-53]|uniref:Uncharacterized protein n=1 Tax=Laetiporus sulphureus 93-53 TaxID=1314785 RepID=A0A165DPM2_9APHY|nr:uncharacterized protein LAESUDRAFT_750580 [Laetiporus sulphureus 93-53]KZT05347.1 hypothetical protein LAESUDRAFT_750580 [Laetiporus sulphureus 93-53]